ncbi:type I-E CRISPR-associated protein Cas6/Cse3/CasE [Methylocystis echinoides]|uniref:Type I-E CRISPR-associated protein Cas6/Cse3/CasE n=1 Tax=Methylocystis echinoides TaxID=29468 RepID=A0A9W6GV22_9HYPH|nr:type I-E CRISPR-associated protein Cas6/Cse3/CasE [Methylocystis echinoides]GLI93430.1 type I-E CRISPR-associated protein Cas6/Cse3/CasE [Methylocystis echinoides]
MSGPLYFSRAKLRNDPALEALAPVLMPSDAAARVQTDHRLMWSLFAGDREAPRDFLFRRETRKAVAPGASFLILSKRPPSETSPLFEVETKSFAPALSVGDRLHFSLYANPAINRSHRVGERKVTRRHDVVMDALRHVPAGDRADARERAIQEAGRAWLTQKGEQSGFALAGTTEIDGYEQLTIARDGGAPIILSVLCFEGQLNVTEPGVFLRSLAEGFGRARAFGCGLMLIRRA